MENRITDLEKRMTALELKIQALSLNYDTAMMQNLDKFVDLIDMAKELKADLGE